MLVVKESACQWRRYKKCVFNPWVGKISWRRTWQPTPVSLPRESYGQRSLVGYSSWGRRVRYKWSDLACMHSSLVVASQGYPDGSAVKNLPAMQVQVWSLGWEDPLEKETAIHSGILAWEIPWTEKPGQYSPWVCKRAGHDWRTKISNSLKNVTNYQSLLTLLRFPYSVLREKTFHFCLSSYPPYMDVPWQPSPV